MPAQPPQWTDFLSCSNCLKEFTLEPNRFPVTLLCGHSICRDCIEKVRKHGCQFDPSTETPDLVNLSVNFALLQLVLYQSGNDLKAESFRPRDSGLLMMSLGHNYHSYVVSMGIIEGLALYLKDIRKGIIPQESELTKPMQRKLVNLTQCQLALDDGRLRSLRACRALGERSATELILAHQNPTTLSGNLWTEVRARGCQFLGPAMQEEALKLILLALEDGSELSRKVLVMFVVQKLQQQFPQASKTSIGHVVQLLYRASCFVVKKREGDSSLMRLKEIYRTYSSLRREHDAQVVQIAREAGLRIAPDQWSALLYGDQDHKSHMQSVIDRLQSGESFRRCISDLTNAIDKSGDPGNLSTLKHPFEVLSEIGGESSNEGAQKNDWNLIISCLESVKMIIKELVVFSKNHSRDLWQDEDTLAQSAKFKTSFCRDVRSKGRCPRGATCTFAHSEEELHHYRNKRKKAGLSHTVAREKQVGDRSKSPLPPCGREKEGKQNELKRPTELKAEKRKSIHSSMQHGHVDPQLQNPQYFYPNQFPAQPPIFQQKPHNLGAQHPPQMQYPQMPPHAYGPQYHQPNVPYHPYQTGNHNFNQPPPPGPGHQVLHDPNMVVNAGQAVLPRNVSPGHTPYLQPPVKHAQYQYPMYASSNLTQSHAAKECPNPGTGDSLVKPNGPMDQNMSHFTVTVSFQSKPSSKQENHPPVVNQTPECPGPHGTVARAMPGGMLAPPMYNQFQMLRSGHFEGQTVPVNYAPPTPGHNPVHMPRTPPLPPPTQVMMAPGTHLDQADFDRKRVFPPIHPHQMPIGAQVPAPNPRVAVVAPQPIMTQPPVTSTILDASGNVAYQNPMPPFQPILCPPSMSPVNQPQNPVLVSVVPRPPRSPYHMMEHPVGEMQIRNQIPATQSVCSSLSSQVHSGDIASVREERSRLGTPVSARSITVPKSIDEATVEELERRKDQIIHKLIKNQTEKKDDGEKCSVTNHEPSVRSPSEGNFEVLETTICSSLLASSEVRDNLQTDDFLTNVVDVIADMDTRTTQVTVRGTDHINPSHSNKERTLDDAKMHHMLVRKNDYRNNTTTTNSNPTQPLCALIRYSSGPQEEEDEMIPFSDRPTVSKYGPIARSVRTRPSNSELVQVNANADVLTHPVAAVNEAAQHENPGQTSIYSSFETLHAVSYFPASFPRSREAISAQNTRIHPNIPAGSGAMTNNKITPTQAAHNSKLLHREETALQQNQVQSYPEDLQLAMELQQIELGIHQKKQQQNQ